MSKKALIKLRNQRRKESKHKKKREVMEGYVGLGVAGELDKGYYQVHYGTNPKRGYHVCYFNGESWYLYNLHPIIRMGERVRKPNHILTQRLTGRVTASRIFYPTKDTKPQNPLRMSYYR
ncbi:MAG: hypothetical protein ACPGO5_04865 [Patescibacteria group bacterium]